MTNINIGIHLPNDAVTQKIAFIGRTGSGKSYASSKLAEEFYKIGAQFVVLDPVGVWFGLRLSANGKDKGLSIPVFGGLHGDIPLEPTSGKLLADLIVDKGLSAILDISQFEHNADKARFAEDFAARFFFKKKSAPSAIHLFLEEAQEFIPQNPGKGEERMLGVFERLWKLGRNFGIGGSIISQRPQEVNKKALNQTECLFAFQMTGTHERKAIQTWIEDKGIDEDISAILPKLEVGQPRIWSPQWLKISKNIIIPLKETFNASSTPEVGQHAIIAKPLAPLELEKIKDEMKQSIDKAKSEDPKLLQKRIRELETQLKIPVKTQNIDMQAREELQALHKNYNIIRQQLAESQAMLKSWKEGTLSLLQNTVTELKKPDKIFKEPKIIITNNTITIPVKEFIPGKVIFGRCEREIYNFLYSNQDKTFTRVQIAAMIGYTPSSGGFNNSMGKLNSIGALSKKGNGLTISEIIPDIPVSNNIKYSIDLIKNKLSKCEREIFEVLIEQPEHLFTKEELGEATPSRYSSQSGGFNNALGKLNSIGFIQRESGSIRLSTEIREML